MVGKPFGDVLQRDRVRVLAHVVNNFIEMCIRDRYMAIRKVPPPDICRTITQNKDLVDAMRKLDGCNLTPDQIKSVTTLFASFQENREGEPIK